jgi:putative heme-binding domain-containing protein
MAGLVVSGWGAGHRDATGLIGKGRRFRVAAYGLVLLILTVRSVVGQTPSVASPGQPVESLLMQLLSTPAEQLAVEVDRRGDPVRGGLVYFTSPAACTNCHEPGPAGRRLGPDLTQPRRPLSTREVIEAILHPSWQITEGFGQEQVLLEDGTTLTGLVIGEDDEKILLRPTSDLGQSISVARRAIEVRQPVKQSLMPDGLAAVLGEQRDFLDLVSYVTNVSRGGPARAAALRPAAELLVVPDDTADLDHAGIIRKLGRRDFEAGEQIYHGYCFNCHGHDGETPSLPTARAFRSQPLKFGSDPYQMFLTLSRGNGLMAAMNHLTPKQRYQAVHYIREAFLQKREDFTEVGESYLDGLPRGTRDGTELEHVDRDFGPAVASQLSRKFESVLTINLGGLTVSYDLHSLDQAGIWRGGFLDLSETQHQRPRGEGTAEPDGEPVVGLEGWAWGHDGSLDYSRHELLPRGPLPGHWLTYHGHHLHGNSVLLEYAIDGREVLEAPAAVAALPGRGLRQRLSVGPGGQLLLAVAGPGAGENIRLADGGLARLAAGHYVAVQCRGGPVGTRLTADEQGRLTLTIPAATEPTEIEVVRWVGRAHAASDIDQVAADLRRQTNGRKAPSLTSLTAGGPDRWPETVTTVGTLGLERGGYRLDTLTLPDETPWNTWFRTAAIDFFSDGRMVVTTYGGDVWVVSGIDEQLLNLRWKRFAAGLYEPLGVKVVDGLVVVTCKDRLVRLHDQDSNGEADFYENLSADKDVSVNFHAFNFDLQHGPDGTLYYAKSGHGSDADLPGAIIAVAPDGSRQVYATGFRTPNGLGMLPDGRLTASDNQGQWTPASKISLIRPGGYYGWVADYSVPGMWAPGGGMIDLDRVMPREVYERPFLWLPQELDNSSGGQVFADDHRFGPLAGRLLHTSFGKGWMFAVMRQEIAGVSQAAAVRLPFFFRTGIMRPRVNPADGQVYAAGLQGWNGGGRAGLADGGIQRLWYRGEPVRMITDCRVEPNGLRLDFNFPLDPESACNPQSYDLVQWNYRRTGGYGSKQYVPSTGAPGTEPLAVLAADLTANHRSVLLKVKSLQPVDQLRLQLSVTDADRNAFVEEIHWTINTIPEETVE